MKIDYDWDPPILGNCETKQLQVPLKQLGTPEFQRCSKSKSQTNKVIFTLPKTNSSYLAGPGLSKKKLESSNASVSGAMGLGSDFC